MKDKFLHNLKEVLLILCASLATAVAVEVFLLPNYTLIGGVQGVASILDILLTDLSAQKWYVSAGVWQLVVNVPIIIYCFCNFRKRFSVKTMLYVLFLAVELVVLRVFGVAEIFKSVLAADESDYDKVIYVLLGGALHGVSLPIMLSVNASTCGSDIVGLIVQRHSKKNSSWAMRVILAINTVVIAIASVVYYLVRLDTTQAVNMFIYSIAAMFVGEIVQETIFSGFSSAIELEVTTDKPEEMADALKEGLKHGVTSVKVVGGYTHQEKTMLLCVINKSQIVKARRIINQVDSAAFAYVENVKEVIGKGFANKEIELDDNDKEQNEKRTHKSK